MAGCERSLVGQEVVCLGEATLALTDSLVAIYDCHLYLVRLQFVESIKSIYNGPLQYHIGPGFQNELNWVGYVNGFSFF
jgi:hypothetical protein